MTTRCKYIYREGDLKVKKKEYKPGQQCKGFPDKKGKYKGYCFYHYWTLYKRGELKLEGEDKAEIEAKIERAEINKEKAKNNRITNKKEVGEKATEYLYYLGKLAGEGINAVSIYESIKKLNPLPSMISGTEKYLFALWLASPANSRIPEDMIGFAELVGVSVGTLTQWQHSDTIYKLYSENRKQFMAQYGHIADMMLVSAMMTGNLTALKMYRDEFPVDREKKIKGGKRGRKEVEAIFNINQAAFVAASEVLSSDKVGRLKTDTGKKMEEGIMHKLMKDEVELVEQ